MSSVRIKFTKTGAMKFIGHLDVMRYFQKAMRRAGIPIAFTGGYSPHMIMSFANPLGIGLTSEGEYFDIEVTEDIPSAAAVKQLNSVMAEGISVKSFHYLPEGGKTGMSIVAAADYLVFPKYGGSFPAWGTEGPVADFMGQKEILVMKKTKKSEKETDIRPLIYRLEARADGIFMKLSAGSVENLKPQLVTAALEAFGRKQNLPGGNSAAKDNFALQYHRLEMYAESGGGLVPMDDLGSVR